MIRHDVGKRPDKLSVIYQSIIRATKSTLKITRFETEPDQKNMSFSDHDKLNPDPEVGQEEEVSQPGNISVRTDNLMPLFLEITGTHRNRDKGQSQEIRETPSTRPSCARQNLQPEMPPLIMPNPQSDESDFATSSKRSSVGYPQG